MPSFAGIDSVVMPGGRSNWPTTRAGSFPVATSTATSVNLAHSFGTLSGMVNGVLTNAFWPWVIQWMVSTLS